MIATSKIQNYNTTIPTDPDFRLGYEYSGVASGKKVMGLLEFGSMSIDVKTDPEYTWEIPDDWSLQDAATIPLNYAMVYYDFFNKYWITSSEIPGKLWINGMFTLTTEQFYINSSRHRINIFSCNCNCT